MNQDTLGAQTAATQPHTVAPTTQPLFSPDTLYANYFSAAPRFCFDHQVARVFPDMIRRSVPGYGTLLELIPPVAARCLSAGDRVYDLGCSVGAGLLAVRHALAGKVRDHGLDHSASRPPIALIGVDNSEQMLARAQALFRALPAEHTPGGKTSTASEPSGSEARDENPPWTVQFVAADITDMSLEASALVLLNYTLQFLPLTARDDLLCRIHAALKPGGHLLISEKMIQTHQQIEDELAQLHDGFKESQGYSALEVAGKRQALESVLIRETADDLLARLERAGFTRVTRLMQCLQFCTFLAIK